jgi:hypothetical protein
VTDEGAEFARPTEKSVPVPLSETSCVAPGALSVMDSEAVRAPTAPGVKMIARVQSAFADSVAEHPFVAMEKSCLFDPVMLIDDRLSTLLPTLAMLIDWLPLEVVISWLGKPIDGAESETLGAIARPVSKTAWGLPAALSLIVSDALRKPETVGANVIWNVQEDPAAKLVPQLFVAEKSPASGAPIVALEIVRAAWPEFVRTTGTEPLESPTA